MSLLFPVNAMEQKAYKTVTNRDVIYVVEQDGTFSHSWQFDKQNYKNDINFSLNLSNESRYSEKINSKIDDDVQRQYLFFEHHGTLPTDALMKVKVSEWPPSWMAHSACKGLVHVWHVVRLLVIS
jgi:hypothetical protein